MLNFSFQFDYTTLDPDLDPYPDLNSMYWDPQHWMQGDLESRNKDQVNGKFIGDLHFNKQGIYLLKVLG